MAERSKSYKRMAGMNVIKPRFLGLRARIERFASVNHLAEIGVANQTFGTRKPSDAHLTRSLANRFPVEKSTFAGTEGSSRKPNRPFWRQILHY